MLMPLALLTGCQDENEGDSSVGESSQDTSSETEPMYYDTIEITKDDVLPQAYLRHGMVFLDYYHFIDHLNETAAALVDESMFENKKAVLCIINNEAKFIGFKEIGYNGSEPVITCEYDDGYINDNPFSTYSTTTTDRMFVVLVPEDEIPDFFTSVSFDIELSRGYDALRMAHAPQLGDKEQFYLFKTEKELLKFEEENEIYHVNYGYNPDYRYAIDGY